MVPFERVCRECCDGLLQFNPHELESVSSTSIRDCSIRSSISLTVVAENHCFNFSQVVGLVQCTIL